MKMIKYDSKGAYIRQDCLAQVYNISTGGCHIVTVDGRVNFGDMAAEDVLWQMRQINE